MTELGNPPSLTEWINRASTGDSEAQWTLFNLYESQIFGYIKHQLQINRCVQPQVDCLDVANSVWSKALDPKNLENLRSADAFQTWLYRIAKNESITHLRQCTRNRPAELEEDDSYEPLARFRTSEEMIEASESIQQILIRARSISKRLYKILVLTLSGYTAEEIGERLGISPNNVRVTRRRGLLKIKAMMNK